MRAAVTAPSLSRDPLADVCGAVPEFDPAGLSEYQQLHGITVNQLDLREIEGHNPAIPQLHANDLQVIGGESTADAQGHTAFNRESIDSAGHARVV